MFSNIFRDKKILVTGDTGFKGSWLSLWLSEMGAQVFGYALPPNHVDDNFLICELKNRVAHENGDIRELPDLIAYFDEIKPDIVFHLAAQALVLESYSDPHTTFATNIMGTVNLFEAVRKTPSVKVVINVTSDKCYTNNEWVWGYREKDPLGGHDPYSASKSASEVVTASYISSYFSKPSTPNVASVRAGNVIGAGDWAENRIIPDFFRAIQQQTPLVIRNPSATRPWQHVLEPLSGYLLLAAKLFQEGEKFQGAWNFGPMDIMNRSVEDLIAELLKKDNCLEYSVQPNQDAIESHLLKLDISKAVKSLGWMPVLDFEKTVELTAEGYFSDQAGHSGLKNRLDTISHYIELAKTKKLDWATY